MNHPVVNAANRTASVIGAVKITLLALNILAGLLLIATGINARPSQTAAAVFEGELLAPPTETGTSLWWLFVLAGVVTLVVNSLLIFAILGWFEHMLRTQTETLRIAAAASTPITPGPLGTTAGEIQTVPMNYPLVSNQ